MIETRILEASDLRNVCVVNGYYTRGSVKSYEKLFDMIPAGNVTIEDIYNMAYDITIYSDTEKEGCSEKEFLENVMFKIGKACNTLFEL